MNRFADSPVPLTPENSTRLPFHLLKSPIIEREAPWWRSVSRTQWLILGVAWLGWVFDIGDTALFNFAKGPMLTEMLGAAAYKAHGPAVEGQIQMLFLLGWSLGGLLFGVLADRWGRTKTLTLTILIYCGLTGLTALCRTPEQVALVRMLTGIGIGGEWAAGAALVAEALPDRARAGAAAILQSAAALGPVLAALANLALIPYGWRGLFLAGILPAALTVAIRFCVAEPEARPKGPSAPLVELFADKGHRRNALVALCLGFAGIAGAGTVTFWLPNLVRAAGAVPPAELAARTSYATFAMHAGTLAGVLLFPWLCERIGRKAAFASFFLLSPLSIALAAFVAGSGDFRRLLWAAPLMSFFSIGLSSGFGLYFTELFPDRLRATGAGFAYNTGRILTAPVPKWTGELIKRFGGNVGAGVAVAACVYIVGLLALPFARETKGQPLARE